MTELDKALALQSTGEGAWTGHADARYEAGTGMFGGWTAGVLLKSVLHDARAQGTPIAITVHYLKIITPGSDVKILARTISASKSLSYWHAELALSNSDEPAAIATIVLANRRESVAFNDASMPDAPAPDTLPESRPPVPFGKQTLMRPVMGFPPIDQPNSRSIAWVRETSGRAMDYVQLSYLSDAYPPRVWYKGNTFRQSSTSTLSVYFFAGATELADIGDDYILTDATGTRAEQSIVGQRAHLWSRNGALLATSEQLHWFR